MLVFQNFAALAEASRSGGATAWRRTCCCRPWRWARATVLCCAPRHEVDAAARVPGARVFHAYAMKDLSYALEMAEAAGVRCLGRSWPWNACAPRSSGSRGGIPSGGAGCYRPVMTVSRFAAWRAPACGPGAGALARGRLVSPSKARGSDFAEGRQLQSATRRSRCMRRRRHGRSSSPPSRRGIITASSQCWPASPVFGHRRQLAFMQHAHVARRVLEIGTGSRGQRTPAPMSLRPRPARPAPNCCGPICAGDARGHRYAVYYETAGAGRDLLCLHTAGADGRQFHGLMAGPAHHRMASAGGVRSALARQVAAAGRRDPRLMAAERPTSMSS